MMSSDYRKTDVELHHQLDHSQILLLRDHFIKSNMSLTEVELKEILEQFHISYDASNFHQLFKQIDTNGDGDCSFDEFISFLMIQFKLSDPNSSCELLQLPIEGIPKQYRSNHLVAINRIRYYSMANGNGGLYMTSSKDGTLTTWDSNFQLLRTNKSTNPFLKANKTWILDFLYLENVRMICTSSIECDIRFYDTRANAFQLRLIISSLTSAINCMNYWYPTAKKPNVKKHSKLVMGDFVGNVILLSFDANDKRVFQSTGDFRAVTWADLLAGETDLLHIKMLPNIHADTVTQVEYHASINAIFSSSEYDAKTKEHKSQTGLVISELGASKSKTIFRMPRGVTCFTVGESMVATGGPDCLLRLWSTVIAEKAMAVFPGHTAGISYIFAQDNFKRIYSFDKSRMVKVWDVVRKSLLQTYNDLATAVMDRSFVTAFYNDFSRQLIIGGTQINSVNCWPLLDATLTDGHTHAATVSVGLFNQLFNTIVTCGFDSSIINWNLENGERLTFIKHAHTTTFYGTVVPVEITAACFNPIEQFLLTAAGNGTLKVWNFNAGICIRNLSLDSDCEITAVYWLPSKILCVGRNKRVTEFAMSLEQPTGSNWIDSHAEDILASAVCDNAIATGSYNGELIIWRLETGQPFKKYLVYNPTECIKINEVLNAKYKTKNNAAKCSKAKPSNRRFAKKINSKNASDRQELLIGKRILSEVQLPSALLTHSEISVNDMIFLRARKVSPGHGTLVVALSNGIIQFYSHHNLGNYIDSFNAIHKSGDSVVVLATDEKNEYLFTGTAFGYVKTWLILNYCVPTVEQTKISMPRLRLKFPFLIRDLWEGRSKRVARTILNPILVNSFRAHMQTVCTLAYIDVHRIMLSTSSDHSARLWTLPGRYIETLGSYVKHDKLTIKLNANNGIEFRVPPDIQHAASSTTIKVLTGATEMDQLKKLQERRKEQQNPSIDGNNNTTEGGSSAMDGNPLNEPILGKYFQLPFRVYSTAKPKIDTEFPFVPVYKHLRTSDTKRTQDIITKGIQTRTRVME